MSQTISQYRTGLSHETFPTRFTGNALETLNSMMPNISHQEHIQYQSHVAFLSNNRENDQRKVMFSDNRERRENLQQSVNQYLQNSQICNNLNSKQSLQNFKPQSSVNSRTKIKVDVSTMTDPEEEDPNTNWQNVAVPTNTKVAEYLTSLRQFLKLSNPGEKKKRQLGDVKIMTGADGTRLFCCPECHVAYPDKSLLEPHLAGHKIERRWLCGVCGAGLKRKEHLDRHQLCHTDERPFACTACPKAFKRNEHLTRHFIIHSGEKTQELKKKFTCSVCGSGHSRKELLERHEETHLEHRPYACAQCGKAFKRNEHLARHIVTHSGLKPHACIHCGKAFYRKDHLIKHAQSHSQPTKPKIPIP